MLCFTVRDIKVGEELLFDYGPDYFSVLPAGYVWDEDDTMAD